ncbi:GTPase family protein [Peptostreptococcus sp.]|uniref:GTPase family protein n=1 Tax=Peptostreptococcus sp. TaxID=1262 RepID=UPI001CB2145F|nr:GTPase [Peptostreptococcus sp.]MBF1049977.1 50S ribosome-binding GTPase [Peptostreptococcus sp.]
MAINFSTYRKSDIDKNLDKIQIHPLDVMVTGVTGAGKSTTLNAFFQKTVAKVGDGVDPETMELDSYMLNDLFRVWDTPGLGDGVDIDLIHKKKMIDLLYKTYTVNDMDYGFIDMVLIIIEGINRDMGTTYTLLNEVIVPNIQNDRIFVLINQADVAMKGRHWNYFSNTPDLQLLNFLDEQAYSIQKRVREATGISIMKPVYYSAEYGWNVQKVLDFIIDNMPTERRLLMK